ncbi:regulator of microtubule dynamics protein 1 [Frankliniella occidentalis]|uniref:Regulator of microtubule dynamics protein 1 n=1 Tax=Frankliniella occidentalis TaxID=133901 RepID=A0A6J1S090_FRAOC|nr:regulator of microtubule dynamics protein 1 [Frankliniella occidentalis]XP_052130504.1 regulator of microtubule dynamics protein 1 [Frankliniella occidentalis]
MISRAKVFANLFACARATSIKQTVIPLTFFRTRATLALKLIKPIALCSGSFVVLAATSPSKQTLSSKDLNQITKKADALFNDNKFEDVLKLLRPFKEDRIEDIIWRISRAAYTLSKSQTISKEEHATLVEESYAMAKLTIELNENSALGHKWMSIALDAYSNLQGFRERCATLTTVLNHMLKSIELDPTDATVIYMVGMWYYSITDLAWYQRSVLQAIAGKLPAVSYEEALTYFKRAEEISPNFYSLNLLMLGKCYHKLGDLDSAIAYLRRAINYPKFTDDDHKAHQEASELLKKLKA